MAGEHNWTTTGGAGYRLTLYKTLDTGQAGQAGKAQGEGGWQWLGLQ